MKWKTIREQKAQSAECDSVFARLLNSIRIFDVPPSSFRHYIFNCFAGAAQLVAGSLTLRPKPTTKTKRKREKTEHKKSQTKSNKNNHMNRYVDEWMLLSRYEILLSKHYSLREWFDSMVESSMCVCVGAHFFSPSFSFAVFFVHNIVQHTITRIKNQNSYVYLTHCHSYADTLIQYTRKTHSGGFISITSHHRRIVGGVCVCGFWVADGCSLRFSAMERWQMNICFSICDVKEKSCFLSFYLLLVVRFVVLVCVR